jgi:hypothetical protein
MAPFELFVDDNYHYMDEAHRYSVATFASWEEAVAAAKRIVDEFLAEAYRPGMTSGELYRSYTGFGEDPFVAPEPEEHFSAWDYARGRCRELCTDEDAAASSLRHARWPPEIAAFPAVVAAALGRSDLAPGARRTLEAFHRGVEAYPDAMPREGRWYWLRVESRDTAYTVYLHPDRFTLQTAGRYREPVKWDLRFRGTGRLDYREGDAAAALGAMRSAAAAPESVVKASGGQDRCSVLA